ncbi:hypothetical protein Patl1_34944 [Pistacia atlantica]|uniref:Uncharacterized protein n=1 Tax=Pistacia atlantica TaxID=434234 RepID=A0ACC0ZQH8_9ROSI|nr:hypothetical protein Patl1_34944 [Pistacia atlantica]
MASTSQSLRYGGPGGASAPSGGSFDALNRILLDLCTHGKPKGASLALKKQLVEEARDLSGEAFSRFMDQLYDRISSLLDSNDVAENLGALRAIDELADVALGENASKVSKFSGYMRTVFEVKRDREILVLASKVLGHLAGAGGAMTADEVEFQHGMSIVFRFQVKMALDWLRGDRVEYRRFAAVLILKEMAENASTVFNVHVPEFVDAIWVALRDPTLAVRERAVEALRACLRVIEKRETRWRVRWCTYHTANESVFTTYTKFLSIFLVQFLPPSSREGRYIVEGGDATNSNVAFLDTLISCWCNFMYYRMFEATQDGLGRNAPVHSIHGSLLAVGELLREVKIYNYWQNLWLLKFFENTGEFMMSRYREVAEIVLRYLEHRDRLVRLSITSLLPCIAHFLRDRFVTNYLKICMNHILAVLRIPAERDSGFIALGEMAGALDGELIHYLPTITSHLREAIAPSRGKPSLEALACVGNIAKAMGPVMESHVRGLLDVMFSPSASLSGTLVDALEQITVSIPSLLPTIQDRLLDSISLVLSKSHYSQARPAAPLVRGNIVNIPQQVSDLNGSALVQLALQTLARFNFKVAMNFSSFSVVVYLDDEDKVTRKDAALSCCKLVANSFSGVSCTQFGSSRSNRTGGKRRRPY